MSFRPACIALVAALALPAFAAPPVTLACKADLDGNDIVDGADLGVLLSAWGGKGPGDLNDDGVVDGADLGMLLSAWGALEPFDYGPSYRNAEAWQVALEMLGSGGPLTAPKGIYERVERDMALIRAFEPALASQAHTLAWAPTQLIAAVIDGAPVDEYDCLNDHFQLVNAQEMFSFGGLTLYLLQFPGKFNVPAMGALYAALDAVQFAEPNALVGGQNYWSPAMSLGGVWIWNVDDGFHDCFDGCDCHNYYTFSVDAEGVVTLLSFEQVGAPWCDF